MIVPRGDLDAPTLRGDRLDLYAATLSALCLVHCLALPLLASLLPLAGQLSENEDIHKVLALMAAPVTLWIGSKSLRTDRAPAFVLIAFPGLGLLLAAAFLEPVSAVEQPLTVTGAVLLASAHLRRWTRHRSAASGRRRQPG